MAKVDKQIPIRMSAELLENLSEAAEGAGISMAEFVRQAAEEKLGRSCRRCHGTGVDPKVRK